MTTKKATHKKVRDTTPDEIINGSDEPTVTETVAGEPIRVDDEHAVVKEEKRMPKKHNPTIAGRGGDVVAVVDVPAHQAEVVLASSSIDGLALAAGQAWDAVKADDDASFATAQADFRRHLINVAEETYKSGKSTTHEGTTMAKFESEILKFRTAQMETKKAAKAA